MDDPFADFPPENLIVESGHLFNFDRKDSESFSRQQHSVIRHPAMMQLNRPQLVNDQLMGMSNRRRLGFEAVDLILWKKLVHINYF